MDKTELMTSINRYVELYYDIQLNEDNFLTEIKNIRENNSDDMLDEYWAEYKNMTFGSVEEPGDKPKKQHTVSTPVKDAEEKDDSNSEATVEVYFRGVKF